jgi:hypothetical protein
MSGDSLREQLVGAWKLVSFVERDVETGIENRPWGERPLGLILYTPDGYVSAQLQGPNRTPFATEHPLRGTPEEYAGAGSSYIAYSGRYFVEEDTKSLSHEMEVSLFPNWFGQRQMRLVQLNGEHLNLIANKINGVTATLTWRRADSN